MDQDEIFKLLLLILLLSNGKDNDCSGDETRSGSSYFSSLNEIIIITLLFNAFNSDRRRDNEEPLRPRDTTF